MGTNLKPSNILHPRTQGVRIQAVAEDNKKNLGVAEEQRLPRFSSKANSEQAAPKVQSWQGQDGAPPQILEENQQAP